MTNRRGPARPFPWVPVLGGVAAILLITVVILTFDGGGDIPEQFGEPTISGSALPRFADDPASDPAIGLPIPSVQGADFEGNPVSITNDGRPKIIVFLAHWCSVCQAEVPVVQAWVDSGGPPEGVDIYSVPTSTAETRTNFPPSEWLEREGWTSPVLVDDTAYSVGDAFGLNAFPFFVFVRADGTVAGRLTGALPAEVLTEIADSLTS
ncbi:MAG TPA: TlpA disulfide reductase family protein [Acidimicrobiia bacterium]|nr:TlpA disulfide reductase family protein [Acidimicrobiia bacterium]